MNFGILEFLALILIVLSAVKLVVLLINPQSWFESVRKLYTNPQITSGVALILALIVLYLLIDSGVTIVEIMAVCLFLALLIVIGIAKYAKSIIDWANQQDMKSILKEQWLYALIWILLLGWGLQAIFFI